MSSFSQQLCFTLGIPAFLCMLSAPFAGCKCGCFDFAQGLCSTLWVPKQLSAACVLYWCRKVLSFELPSNFMETPFWFLRSRISFLWRIWTEFTQIVFNNPILRKIWHSIKWHELSQFSLLLVAIQAVSVRFGIRGCAFFPAFLDLVIQVISWVILVNSVRYFESVELLPYLDTQSSKWMHATYGNI